MSFLLWQNKLLRCDIGTRELWVSVWDWDKFGRNKFLGEVRFPLGSKNLTDSRELWYNLQEKVRETFLYSGWT